MESGASDVYFEDSIEILVGAGETLELDAIEAFLREKEIEFTTLAPAQP